MPTSSLKSSWLRETQAWNAAGMQQLLPCPGDTQLDTAPLRESPSPPAAIPAPSPQFHTGALPAGAGCQACSWPGGAFLGNQIAAVCWAQLYPRDTNIVLQPQVCSQQPFTNSSDPSRAGWSCHTNPYPRQLIQGSLTPQHHEHFPHGSHHECRISLESQPYFCLTHRRAVAPFL